MINKLKWLESLFIHLPLPLSKMVYDLGRSVVLKDARRPYFDRVWQHLRQIRREGDYLEFGVYRGTSFIANWNLAKKHEAPPGKFFAFDCFSGLPENEDSFWQKGDFSCSRERFLTIVRKAGVPLDRVVVVEGLFSDSLTPEVKQRHQLSKAAFIHVDCDLYTSTQEVLRFVEDLVVEGTVIAFDDWSCFEGSEQCGESKAFQEWSLRSRFDEFYTSKEGKAFVCVR